MPGTPTKPKQASQEAAKPKKPRPALSKLRMPATVDVQVGTDADAPKSNDDDEVRGPWVFNAIMNVHIHCDDDQ